MQSSETLRKGFTPFPHGPLNATSKLPCMSERGYNRAWIFPSFFYFYGIYFYEPENTFL
jgi:hypothetical protein